MVTLNSPSQEVNSPNRSAYRRLKATLETGPAEVEAGLRQLRIALTNFDRDQASTPQRTVIRCQAIPVLDSFERMLKLAAILTRPKSGGAL